MYKNLHTRSLWSQDNPAVYDMIDVMCGVKYFVNCQVKYPATLLTASFASSK